MASELNVGGLHVQTSDVSVTPNASADNLVVEENGNAGISIISGTSNTGNLTWGDTTADMAAISYSHGTNDMSFRVNSTNDVLTLASTGNAGLGVSPPAFHSTVRAMSIGSGGAISGVTSGNPNLTFTDNSYVNAAGNNIYRTGNPTTKLEQYNGTLTFLNAPSGVAGATVSYVSRLAIDSAGNVTQAGGNYILQDGSGSNVGQITTLGGNNITICGSQSNHCGLSFATNAILPCTVSVVNNNTVDIGADGNAYKDLYLGGGLYVGGTGAANKLDDFEVGTWTPVIAGGGCTNLVGKYTRVGNKVTVTVSVMSGVLSGITGTLNAITGLPFTVGNTRSMTSSIGFINLLPTGSPIGVVIESSDRIDFLYNNASASWSGANFANSTGANLHFSATYFV